MADGSTIGFTKSEIQHMLDNLDQFSDEEIAEIDKLVAEIDEQSTLEKARDDLIAFCCYIQSDYKVGAHHRRLATLLEDIESRKKDRICVSVPPRHGKSQMVSIYYAAWYLGKNPTHKVMLVSHTTDLAVDFGRKVRNLIASDAYQEVFPGVALAKDSKSAGRWNTNQGGEFFAAGVGSALAGRGAHLLLVDDPHSEQDILNGNFEVFQKAYEWFAYGARTRLMPGGAVAVVHCMTGDTGVLRPDGTETPLRDIRPGDMVMSYDGDGLVPKKVLNWANMGADEVFDVVMDDGNVVSGNARHPFLVFTGEEEKWVKLGDLKPGMKVRAFVKDAPGLYTRVSCANTITTAHGEVSTGRLSLLGQAIGESSKEKPALNPDVPTPPVPETCAFDTTTSSHTPNNAPKAPTIAGSAPERPTCETVMVSGSPNITQCSPSRETVAPFAELALTQQNAQRAGIKTTRSPSTTATTQTGSVGYSVTDATFFSETTGTPTPIAELQITLRTVIAIRPRGREDVFDIQVEDTENFIANGLVSHNTRWHMDDLIGHLIRDMTNNEDADQYEVFEFPAIMETLDPETGKTVEKALWPEFFDLPALHRTKASMPVFQWLSQYQQKPTAEEGAIIKREWWRLWGQDDPPPCEYIIMSLDAAAETHNRADFSALTVWGVFFNEEEGAHQLILLNSIKERMEFPELKRRCLEAYRDWEPDSFIVEKKSAGVAIYQELRRTGIPVQEYTPHRGTGDKMVRLNSVADIISSGMCWVPARRWAEELVEEIAGFPFMSHDDLVDSAVMALMRFRQGGFIRLPNDWEDDPLPYRRKYEYY